MKPVILTAGDAKFKELIDLSVEQIRYYGYTPMVYDLGGLGIGHRYDKKTEVILRREDETWDTLIPARQKHGRKVLLNRRAAAPWKPQLILDAIESLDEWVHLMWMDGDAVITEPIHEIFRGDYDVAVTMRYTPAKKSQSRYLNVGVLVFRNTPKTLSLLHQSMAEQKAKPKECDQRSMHNLMEKEETGIETAKPGDILNFMGAEVLLLPAQYNHTIGNPSRIDLAVRRSAKIWHLKASYYPGNRELKEQFLREVKKKCQLSQKTDSST